MLGILVAVLPAMHLLGFFRFDAEIPLRPGQHRNAHTAPPDGGQATRRPLPTGSACRAAAVPQIDSTNPINWPRHVRGFFFAGIPSVSGNSWSNTTFAAAALGIQHQGGRPAAFGDNGGLGAWLGPGFYAFVNRDLSEYDSMRVHSAMYMNAFRNFPSGCKLAIARYHRSRQLSCFSANASCLRLGLRSASSHSAPSAILGSNASEVQAGRRACHPARPREGDGRRRRHGVGVLVFDRTPNAHFSMVKVDVPEGSEIAGSRKGLAARPERRRLDRARWMTKTGYRHLLQLDVSASWGEVVSRRKDLIWVLDVVNTSDIHGAVRRTR